MSNLRRMAQVMISMAQLMISMAQLMISMAQLMISMAQVMISMAQVMISMAQLMISMAQVMISMKSNRAFFSYGWHVQHRRADRKSRVLCLRKYNESTRLTLFGGGWV